jgi:hypothetical protein
MGQVADMMRAGVFINTAKAVAGGANGLNTLAAAGNSWATATLITSSLVYVTTAQDGTTGVAIPAAYEVGDEWYIYSKDNSGTSACIIYPPTGGAFNNGSANATFSLTDAKACVVKAVAVGHFLVLMSA